MKKIKVWCEDAFGHEAQEILDVDDDATDEECEQIAMDFMNNELQPYYNWEWIYERRNEQANR